MRLERPSHLETRSPTWEGTLTTQWVSGCNLGRATEAPETWRRGAIPFEGTNAHPIKSVPDKYERFSF
jgi:hypothetical protein